MTEKSAAKQSLIREREFHLATKEKIVGINLYPGQGMDIQVALGEDRDGLFEQVQGSHPENYNIHGEAYKHAVTDPELAELLYQLQLKLWPVVDGIRGEILERRAKSALAK